MQGKQWSMFTDHLLPNNILSMNHCSLPLLAISWHKMVLTIFSILIFVLREVIFPFLPKMHGYPLSTHQLDDHVSTDGTVPKPARTKKWHIAHNDTSLRHNMFVLTLHNVHFLSKLRTRDDSCRGSRTRPRLIIQTLELINSHVYTLGVHVHALCYAVAKKRSPPRQAAALLVSLVLCGFTSASMLRFCALELQHGI